MLVLWLATYAISVSPQLHHFLHRDAQNINHQCQITQIKQHSFVHASSKISVPRPMEAILWSVRGTEVQFRPSFDYRLSPSRAPPAVDSSSTLVG